jgi:hypothetical protein
MLMSTLVRTSFRSTLVRMSFRSTLVQLLFKSTLVRHPVFVFFRFFLSFFLSLCMRAYVRACVCLRACVRVLLTVQKIQQFEFFQYFLHRSHSRRFLALGRTNVDLNDVRTNVGSQWRTNVGSNFRLSHKIRATLSSTGLDSNPLSLSCELSA